MCRFVLSIHVELRLVQMSDDVRHLCSCIVCWRGYLEGKFWEHTRNWSMGTVGAVGFSVDAYIYIYIYISLYKA